MYIVEGNIGVGKSTFLSLIQKHLPSVDCTLEPLDNWHSQSFGQSLLERFYAAPERWAYTLETLAMVSRSRDHMAAQEQAPHHLMERSIYSGHYCFALNGKRAGYFDDIEWDVYMKWVDFIINNQCREPHGFIYLKADADVCHARIAKRKRDGESMIPLEYLEQINYWHDRFLIEKIGITDAIAQVPVLVLDGNIDFLDNPQRMQEHAANIAEFMAQTSGSVLSCQGPKKEIFASVQ